MGRKSESLQEASWHGSATTSALRASPRRRRVGFTTYRPPKHGRPKVGCNSHCDRDGDHGRNRCEESDLVDSFRGHATPLSWVDLLTPLRMSVEWGLFGSCEGVHTTGDYPPDLDVRSVGIQRKGRRMATTQFRRHPPPSRESRQRSRKGRTLAARMSWTQGEEA